MGSRLLHTQTRSSETRRLVLLINNQLESPLRRWFRNPETPKKAHRFIFD